MASLCLPNAPPSKTAPELPVARTQQHIHTNSQHTGHTPGPSPAAYTPPKTFSRPLRADLGSIQFPVMNKSFEVTFKPHEIKTVRIDPKSWRLQEVNLLEE